MPHIADCSASERKVKKEIESFREVLDGSEEEVSGALRLLISAVDYKDSTIARSAFKVVLEWAIDKMSDETRTMRNSLPDIWKFLEEIEGDSIDRVGKKIEAYFDGRVNSLMELRDTIRRLDFEVENAVDLETNIVELKNLKSEILNDWPWEDRGLPPVNREMVTRSRAAYAAGQRGDDIKDIIKRMEDGSKK